MKYFLLAVYNDRMNMHHNLFLLIIKSFGRKKKLNLYTTAAAARRPAGPRRRLDGRHVRRYDWFMCDFRQHYVWEVAGLRDKRVGLASSAQDRNKQEYEHGMLG